MTPEAHVRLQSGRLLVNLHGIVQDHAEQNLRENAQRYSKIVGAIPSYVDMRYYKSLWCIYCTRVSQYSNGIVPNSSITLPN